MRQHTSDQNQKKHATSLSLSLHPSTSLPPTFNAASTSWCVTPLPPTAAPPSAAATAGEAGDDAVASTAGAAGLGEEGLLVVVVVLWSSVKTERPSLGFASRRGRAALSTRGGREGSCVLRGCWFGFRSFSGKKEGRGQGERGWCIPTDRYEHHTCICNMHL